MTFKLKAFWGTKQLVDKEGDQDEAAKEPIPG